jgi:hypothetical protein
MFLSNADKYELNRKLIAEFSKHEYGPGHYNFRQNYEHFNALIRQGADNVNEGLRLATWNNNIGLMQFMIKHGANDADGVFEIACDMGHKEALRFLLAHEKFQGLCFDWSRAFRNACKKTNNYYDIDIIVKSAFENGHLLDFNSMLCRLASADYTYQHLVAIANIAKCNANWSCDWSNILKRVHYNLTVKSHIGIQCADLERVFWGRITTVRKIITNHSVDINIITDNEIKRILVGNTLYDNFDENRCINNAFAQAGAKALSAVMPKELADVCLKYVPM